MQPNQADMPVAQVKTPKPKAKAKAAANNNTNNNSVTAKPKPKVAAKAPTWPKTVSKSCLVPVAATPTLTKPEAQVAAKESSDDEQVVKRRRTGDATSEDLLGGLSDLSRDLASWVAELVGLDPKKVAGAVKLFKDGNTLPFIARYRKEQTGSMNEEELRRVERELQRAEAVEGKRLKVAMALQDRGKLSAELRLALMQASTLELIESIWYPFKSKRETRADQARARGLEPLAQLIEKLGRVRGMSPSEEAARFLSPEVQSTDEALAGARDIIAEKCAHRPDVKQQARISFSGKATFIARRRNAKADEAAKFKIYWDFQKRMKSVKPYQFLAANRGEATKALSLSFALPAGADDQFVDSLLRGRGAAGAGPWHLELRAAFEDALRRLILPGVEREWMSQLKELAEDESFDTYQRNLRSKLLTPPLRLHPDWADASTEPVVAVLTPHTGQAASWR
ncbi:unnamed protein product [Polarella glacialis]|nr:unnamed protein product [Polarella glacialis]